MCYILYPARTAKLTLKIKKEKYQELCFELGLPRLLRFLFYNGKYRRLGLKQLYAECLQSCARGAAWDLVSSENL